MQNTIKLSIIIPTYKRNDLLTKCLDQLTPEAQTLDSSQYEVIVTDDSPDFEAKVFLNQNYPWAKWIEGPHKGPAANRNNGASVAKGDWLVFFDDDCIPDRIILEEYLQSIQKSPGINVFEGRIYVDRPKQRMDEEAPVNETGGYLWSCNFCINRTTFKKMNGFDESFPYAAMEDVDLNYRLKQSGESILFLNKAAVCHPWRIMGGKTAFKKKEHSTKHYLHKHNQEKNRLNYRYWIFAFLRTGKIFVEEVIQKRAKGAKKAFSIFPHFGRLIIWDLFRKHH